MRTQARHRCHSQKWRQKGKWTLKTRPVTYLGLGQETCPKSDLGLLSLRKNCQLRGKGTEGVFTANWQAENSGGLTEKVCEGEASALGELG